MALLDRVRDALEEQVAALGVRDGLPIVMADWFGIPVQADVGAVVDEAARRDGATRYHRDVALLGFAVAAAADHAQPFLRGLDWLRSRKFHVRGQAPTLEADGLAVLGIAVGMKALASNDTEWLLSLIRRVPGVASDAWEVGMMVSARHILGEPEGKIPLDLAAALASKGFIDLDPEYERAAREAVMSLEVVSPDQAVVRLAALRWLLRQEASISLTHPRFEHLVRLLERFEHGLKRWRWEEKPVTKTSTRQRWDIQNEYHVQSILWTMLAPIFPDLVDEEYLRKIGPKQPRADLGIPSLRTIIEVKYMRDGEFAKVLGGVAEDASLYLSGNTGYDHIIAFIWDASASSHRHEELRQGLISLNGVEGAIVVARPGTWVHEEA